MSEKELNLPASDEAVDAILAEVLGSAGSNMAKRYSGDGTSVPERKVVEEPAPQQPAQPAVAAPKNTVSAGASQKYDMSPEMLNEDYRAAAARYDVNGYRISAAQPAGYAPYAPYPAYPTYPVYPQPVAYAPYSAYPAYPAYPQPYAYPAYPTGYEAYAEYPAEQPQATPEQNAGQNAYAAAAGSRVVYDADWAEGKQSKAAQSAQPPVPVMQTANSGKPHVNPAFIDPLSSYEDDEEVPSPYTGSVSFADRHNARAPQQPATKKQGTDFFPAGFSATKNNAGAANGKTTLKTNAASAGEREKVFADFSEDYEKTQHRSREWMMTDEELLDSREQRRRKAADAMQELELDLVEMPDTSRVVVETGEADDDASRRRAEAQQIIAERFSQSAAAEILFDSTETFERDAQRAPQDDSDYTDSSDSDYDYNYNEYENGGDTELYYNSPDANNPDVNEQPVEKKKKGNKFTAFIRRNTPHKGQTKREMISCIIMDLAFLVLIGGLIFCAVYFVNYNKTKVDEEKIKIEFYEEGIADKYTDVQLNQLWTDLKTAYPDVDFPEGLNPDFAKLYAVNQDIAGWLEIEGVDISTEILQADDNDYYLYRNLYKEDTKYGTPFVDYRNNMSSPGLSRNTIVYGHNTHDGLKFYNLTRYLQLSGYKSAPVVKLNTLFNGVTYWKVFAVTLSDSTTDEFEYLYTRFTNENTFLSFIDDIRAHSMFDIPVDVVAGDNILTLYTCYQDLFKDGRLTVFARQVRAGEDLLVDTSNATVNSDCIYPNAYYGITYENSTTPVTGTTAADSATQTEPTVSQDPTEALIEDPTESEEATQEPEFIPGEPEDGGEESPAEDATEGSLG
ncbi:MAG: class B sortase [Clostridia bacterium]|nr:class B sortase [Clostridia bacterium]